MAAKSASTKGGFVERFLNWIERVGNKLPDPALLFVFALLATWIASKFLGGIQFNVPGSPKPWTIQDQLTGPSLAAFMSNMVKTFTGFHPLGVVLVALLGVGVAEESGFINAGIKKMLGFTPKLLLTPMLILVAIVSHTAADAGYVLVIPLGGVLFYAAGRHPLAGIAAAFAGVSGGFSANFIPSGIDPLLQGITQAAAGVIDPTVQVNPLCNWLFCSVSSVLIIGIGWFLTDKVIEPRLKSVAVDGDPDEMPKMEELTPAENRGLTWGLISLVIGCLALFLVSVGQDSPMRSPPEKKLILEDGSSYQGVVAKDAEKLREAAVILTSGAVDGELSKTSVVAVETGEKVSVFDLGAAGLKAHEGFVAADIENALLIKESRKGGGLVLVPQRLVAKVEDSGRSITDFKAPIMQMIVPLIFILFLIPGLVHGYVSGTFKNHRDVIKGMSKAMSTMGYYLVMAFFAALFIDAFGKSNMGAWMAVRGAEAIQSAGLPTAVTIVGIIILCAAVNLLVGSASAKWALIAPIFVPMLMQLNLSPELTQAAYRVGDSTTNIITPLMPYFPLVVAFSQRYVKGTGVGTVISMMLPFSITFFITWTIFLLVYWNLGIPLGLQSTYTYGG